MVEQVETSATVRRGELRVTWLGQAGFQLEAGSEQVLIDPFFSPHPGRAYAPHEDWPTLARTTVVLCTHEHEDHLDVPFLLRLLEAGARPAVIVPAPVRTAASSAGIEAALLLGAEPARAIERAGLTVRPVPAFHGRGGDESVAYGFNHATDASDAVRYLGYVVELGGLRVYHSGDTLLYPEMAEILMALKPDVMLLPINGRDFMRERTGCVGNLNEGEAAWLCAEVGPRYVIPMHYDAMGDNLGDVGRFVTALRAIGAPVTAVVPARDVPVDLVVRSA